MRRLTDDRGQLGSIRAAGNAWTHRNVWRSRSGRICGRIDDEAAARADAWRRVLPPLARGFGGRSTLLDSELGAVCIAGGSIRAEPTRRDPRRGANPWIGHATGIDARCEGANRLATELDIDTLARHDGSEGTLERLNRGQVEVDLPLESPDT